MDTERPIRLAVANDYAVVIAGVASILADERIDVVETGASMPVASDVDIVLYDTFGQVTGDGLDLEDYVRDSGAKVVIYGWNLEPDLIQRALAGGASGYLSKVLTGPVILEALEQIMRGKTVIAAGEHETSVGAVGDWPGRSVGLSPREAEVLALIARGLSNKDIAERAFVGPNTIKTYIRSAYRKIGVERRTQAVLWALENGFLPDRERTIGLAGRDAGGCWAPSAPDNGVDDLTPVHLRDGTEAFVVPLLPANREALRQEYERLSAETRLARFLAEVPRLTDTMLDHLVDQVNGSDHVALVLMVITEDGTELPLGLARIIRYPDDPTTADVAVTVVDDWHGRGVSTALLQVLVRLRPKGVERIVTVMHATNRASLAMLRRLGEVEVSQPEAGVQLVVVDLPDSADSTPHQRGHVDTGNPPRRNLLPS